MPEQTPKLGIKKPLENENVTRASWNENWDILDLMSQKNINQSSAVPIDPTDNDLWIDTSTSPFSLKRYYSSTWEVVGGVTPEDIGAEPEFTKNTAFNKDFGTSEGTVAEGSIRQDSSEPLIVEIRTSDPSSPQVGRMWLRSDL